MNMAFAVFPYGEITNGKVCVIGQKGFGDYRTSIHESMHGLEWALFGYNSTELSDTVVALARDEMKLKSGTKSHDKACSEFGVPYTAYDLNYELLAHAAEAVWAQDFNEYALRIYTHFLDVYQMRHNRR